MADEIKQPEPPKPALRDRRTTPAGVVPKQSQAYVIAGAAVLILFAVMFSKNHAKPAPKPVASLGTSDTGESNARRIDELKADLNEEQRLSDLQQKAQTPAPIGTVAASSQPSGAAQNVAPTPTEKPRDPIAGAEKDLAFKSRFASNLVSVGEKQQAQTESTSVAPDRPYTPSPSATASAETHDKHDAEVNVNAASGQPYVLFEGTTIDTALVNRLSGDFTGPVKVMVTNPVYSHDRQHVLVPEGSFILGSALHVDAFGQKRLAVAFHRIIMPDGYTVDLDKFTGLNQIGETGLNDKVNNHYLQIFGASIALGVIAGAAEATTQNGYNQTGSDSYRQGVASSLSQSSAHVLDRFLNLPPTIAIREGYRIKIYLTEDLLLPAYDSHAVPADI